MKKNRFLTRMTALLLVLVCMLGLLPIAAVLAVWGAMQTVYALECIRLSKRTGDA